MTERPSRQQEKNTERNASEPKVQDISNLVDQSTITLHDLDQRMQHMRASLSHLIAQANLLQDSGAPMGMTYAPSFPHAPQNLGPSILGLSPGWGATPFAYGATGSVPSSAAPFGAPGFGIPQHAPMAGPGPQGISPTGTPSLFGGGPMETRTTRDLKDVPPQTRQPASDVVDDGNNFQIRLEMPGVKKEDMDIMVTDRAVLVTALARLDLEDGVVVVQERGPVVYRRTIQLPGEIKTSECQAKLKDGVLRLSIPKKNPTDSPRHLEIAYG